MDKATDLQLWNNLRAKRRIDSDLLRCAKELLKRTWSESILDWVVVNHLSDPGFENVDPSLLRGIAEVATRTVIAFSFELNNEAKIELMKKAILEVQPDAQRYISQTVKALADKNKWAPDIQILPASKDMFKPSLFTNTIDSLDQWLASSTDWQLRQEHLDRIIRETPRYQTVPLVPAKEPNDDVAAHRLMIRVETIMNWFLHSLNSADDETYEQSILVTLQLLTDMWSSLNRTRINKLLQIKNDNRRLNLTETRYADDPTYKSLKETTTVRQRQIQQSQRGRGRGQQTNSFGNRQNDNIYRPPNTFRGGRGGRGRGGRGGSAPSTPRSSNNNQSHS